MGARVQRPFKALLLDRDGTINVERAEYVRAPEDFVLLPHILEAFAVLGAMGLPVAIVTNQAGIGRGLIAQTHLDAIHTLLSALAATAGMPIAGFAVCPHRSDEGCLCRKPQPGLLLASAAALGVYPDECMMIGDSITDFLAAKAAGCQVILVRTGRQGASLPLLLQEAGYDPASVTIVDDLLEASQLLAGITFGETTVPLSLSRCVAVDRLQHFGVEEI